MPMSDVILKNAFSFNVDLKFRIDEICKPLEKHFGITFAASQGERSVG